jgi:hypothetical protein
MQPSDMNAPKFQEWQLPNAGSFLANLIVFPSFWLVSAPINPDFGWWFAGVTTLLSVLIRILVSKRIIVTGDRLSIGKASIPLSAIGAVTEIEPENQFAEKGPLLDARAYLALKSLNGLVKVDISDKNDPTPYLLISTRRPKDLAKSLQN